METGAIPRSSYPGPFDLQATLESGQTFRWRRLDGRTYRDPAPRGGSAWYRSVLDGRVVAVRQTADALEWRSTGDPTAALRRVFGLDESMATMIDSLPGLDVVEAAADAFPGLRVVEEPFFPTLVSFVLSAQMRVERIHSLVQGLAETYGTAHAFEGDQVHAFPDPSSLAGARESALRDLGLGYRAPYVIRTASMVAAGDLTRADLVDRSYEGAREAATGFVGVGEKVADCVLLFSLGYTEPVPLDTWIRSAIEDHFPDITQASYAATSRAIRERLAPYPGVAQTYLFHYLRHRDALRSEGAATHS
ncbi:MAG: DNA-3-methyladenine glycosylase [Halanaeroarchaeum sp.]